MSDAKIIVPLDFSSADDALLMADKLDPEYCRLKVGNALFTLAGPGLIDKLQQQGYDIFLDLKFHDIPNTVAMACSIVAELGVWMINVHALGGKRMMLAAAEEVAKRSNPMLLVAVTVLTSLRQDDLTDVGIDATPDDQVSRLAALTQECGLDGVVCSALEARRLSNERGKTFCLVTPGIRPTGSHNDDQQRIMTPAAAINAGSHYLVIGRPITRANDPMAALLSISNEISDI